MGVGQVKQDKAEEAGRILALVEEDEAEQINPALSAQST